MRICLLKIFLLWLGNVGYEHCPSTPGLCLSEADCVLWSSSSRYSSSRYSFIRVLIRIFNGMITWVEMAKSFRLCAESSQWGLQRDHDGWGSPNITQSWLIPGPCHELPAHQSSISMKPEEHGDTYSRWEPTIRSERNACLLWAPLPLQGLSQETAWASRPDTHQDKSVPKHLWDLRALLHRVGGGEWCGMQKESILWSHMACCDERIKIWSFGGSHTQLERRAGWSCQCEHAVCLCVMDVASSLSAWCAHRPPRSWFSALLLVGPGHGAVTAWPLGCQIQHHTCSPDSHLQSQTMGGLCNNMVFSLPVTIRHTSLLPITHFFSLSIWPFGRKWWSSSPEWGIENTSHFAWLGAFNIILLFWHMHLWYWLLRYMQWELCL